MFPRSRALPHQEYSRCLTDLPPEPQHPFLNSKSRLTDVGPVELWATRQRRPSAAANPQGSFHRNPRNSHSRHCRAGLACRPDAQSQDRPEWFRIPFGERLLGATPSAGAAVFAAVRPGISRGTEPATALTARAMCATALPQTILAARPSLPQMGLAAAATAWASPWPP